MSRFGATLLTLLLLVGAVLLALGEKFSQVVFTILGGLGLLGVFCIIGYLYWRKEKA